MDSKLLTLKPSLYVGTFFFLIFKYRSGKCKHVLRRAKCATFYFAPVRISKCRSWHALIQLTFATLLGDKYSSSVIPTEWPVLRISIQDQQNNKMHEIAVTSANGTIRVLTLAPFTPLQSHFPHDVPQPWEGTRRERFILSLIWCSLAEREWSHI